MAAQPTPAPVPESDPYLADAVAHAEEGVAMLRRLARIGMEIVEDVRLQCKMADLHPEPRHDPRKGYDLVARSVRLTVALIRKMDDEIVAMRKGEAPVSPVSSAWRTDAVAVPAVWEIAVESAPPAGTPSEEETPDVERPECETERLGEREFERFRRRLIAGEDFQALIEGDFAGCADEIRAGFNALPPSPEVGREDSRLQGGSRVGGEREAGSLGQTPENDSHEHRDIPPPGSRPQARVRPPHFGGGRVLDSPDPPPRE